ncbi:molecular chaperone DnaJ, partial [Amphritea sp.]|uniref:molecular chaperone DnaJ n=1 Tax=Amphritea sp. TaxID=1872502 RepID=UPI003D0C25BB
NETGTCSSGKEGASCQACVKNHELKGKQPYYGLACGTCNGIGQAEPTTERMNKRIKPMLALAIVFLILTFTFALALMRNQYFTEFLAFSGTLMGSVTAFYFNHSKNT